MSTPKDLSSGATAPFFILDAQVVLIIDGDTKSSAENG